MEFTYQFLYQLRHKKWYQTEFFNPLIMLSGLYIIVTGMLFLIRFAICFRYDGLEKVTLICIAGVLCLLLLPIGIVFGYAVKEKNIYNRILDDGKVMEGKIEGFFNSGNGFTYRISLEDPETGKKYHYNQLCKDFQNSKLALTYMKEDKKIYILVDKNNYRKGYVFYDEYFYRQSQKGYFERKERWDGSFQAHPVATENIKKDSDEIIVEGRVLKDTLHVDISCYHSFFATYALTVDVAYFDPEESKVHIFKGKSNVASAVYFNLLRNKEELKVKVKYNKADEKQYTVYLDEVLENL